MTVDTGISIIQLIYPFTFRREEFADRAGGMDRQKWLLGKHRVPVWRKQKFPEDDLMVYVRKYLNPPDGVEPTARYWRMGPDAIRELGGSKGSKHHEPITWHLDALKQSFPFGIENVDLMLFQSGVGFLVLLVRPQGSDVPAWVDFLHAIRFARGQRAVTVRAERITSTSPDEDGSKPAPYFPTCAGGLDHHPTGRGTLGDLVPGLLADGAETRWWDDIFIPGQLIPHATLFIDGYDPDEMPHLIYRVRNFLHSGQGENPSAWDLDDRHANVLHYAENQRFLFSLDGAAFVAFDAPHTPFCRETLPQHVRDQYFLLYLLALHQRFAFMALSEKVAHHWPPADPHLSLAGQLAAFRSLRDTMLALTARAYFTQVMQREHHHRCYRRWQEIFQLERLYRDVSTAIREMHDHLLLLQSEEVRRLQEEQQRQLEEQARAEAERERAAVKRAQRLERAISLVGIFFGVPALLIGFLGISISGVNASAGGMSLISAIAILLIGTAILGGALALLLRHNLREDALEARQGQKTLETRLEYTAATRELLTPPSGETDLPRR